MNKFKTSVVRLREYLGRDKEGLRLLTAVERYGNDARKEVSALKEMVERKQQRLDELFQQERELMDQIISLRNVIAAKDGQLKSKSRGHDEACERARFYFTFIQHHLAKADGVDDLDPVESDLKGEITQYEYADHPLFNGKNFLTLFKKTRRSLPMLKKPRDIGAKFPECLVRYDIPQLSNSCSCREMANLGCFAAIAAVMGVPLVLWSDVRADDFLSEKTYRDVIDRFQRWIGLEMCGKHEPVKGTDGEWQET